MKAIGIQIWEERREKKEWIWVWEEKRGMIQGKKKVIKRKKESLKLGKDESRNEEEKCEKTKIKKDWGKKEYKRMGKLC